MDGDDERTFAVVDWEIIIGKLRKLEQGVILGEYIDTLDAATLSNYFLPDEEEALGGAVILRPELRGLARLIRQLAAILSEAHIAQQGVTSALKAECLKCSKVSSSSALAQDEVQLRPDTTASSGVPSTTGDPPNLTATPYAVTWTSLPAAADDESIPMTMRLQRLFSPVGEAGQTQQQRSEAVRCQLRRRMQAVHDRAIDLLNAKLHAYEIIAHMEKVYVRMICRLAVSKGVSRVPARATFLMDHCMPAVRSHKFLESAEAQDIVNYIRELWSTKFLDSRKNLAERRLLLAHDSMMIGKEQGAIRLKAGAGLTLLAWAISECFNNEQAGRKIWHDPTFAIFTCFGDLLLLLWMWGVSMQVWRSAGIDYVRLLNLQDTELAAHRAPEMHIYAAATDLSLVFLIIFIAFNKAVRGVLHIHGSLAFAHSLPTLMVIYFVYKIVNPFATRSKWLGYLGQVLAAPCYPVKFRDGYIGDLLTSLVRVLIPMCFSFAYLLMSALAWLTNNMNAAASTSNLWWKDSAFFRHFLLPFLTLFPLWIRLMHCLRRSVETGKRWPHMANALKYTSAIIVISFGTFQPALRENPLWVVGFVCATLFQFVWDLTMDWGIVVSSSSPGASSATWGGMALRRRRMLGPLSLYVAVIAFNLVLRFAWALTLLPATHDQSLYSLLLAYLGPVIAAAEILRRMVWGFFRLELEQLEVLGFKPEEPAEGQGDYEKMSVKADGAAENIWDPDGRYGLLPSFTHSVVDSNAKSCFELDWLPLPGSLVDFMAARSWLDGRERAAPVTKLRLAEGVIFAICVLGIISHAARFVF